MNKLKFKSLKGKTFSDVQQNNEDEIIFTVSEDEQYKLYHIQNCCESVEIEDICGDLNDLIGEPILLADEIVHEQDVNPPEIKTIPKYQNSFTWTFYRIGTIKGDVVIRWYGNSNGYYSESVDFCKVQP